MNTTTPIPDAEREGLIQQPTTCNWAKCKRCAGFGTVGYFGEQVRCDGCKGKGMRPDAASVYEIATLTTRAERAESALAEANSMVRVTIAERDAAKLARDEMQDERDAALAREAGLREAVEEISDRHIGDCPAAFSHYSEEDWCCRCYAGLRKTARAAFASTSDPQP